jgi:dinuclear metal center YbgI/SA1388 family protein
MIPLDELREYLEAFAPLRLAADWDNVGLLVGDHRKQISRVMTCLTVTRQSAAEAIREQADLIITHHPLPFRPLKKMTTESVAGELLLELIAAGIAVYSPHTCFDSASQGINQQIAAGLQLNDIHPIQPIVNDIEQLGSGRVGSCQNAITGGTLCQAVKDFFGIDRVAYAGDLQRSIRKVGIACGSAGDFLAQAIRLDCDAFITGETSFHTFLEAEAQSRLLILPGHFATERFAVVSLAGKIQHDFKQLAVWAARDECDPLHSI